MKFRLKEKQGSLNIGAHYVGNQKFVSGDIVESDVDLCKVFRGKFERVDDILPSSKPQIVHLLAPKRAAKKAEAVSHVGTRGPVIDEAPSTSPKVSEVEEPKATHGVDVTENFPDAELAGMNVYHNVAKDSFVVTDSNSGEILKKAKSEEIVSRFLKKQLG